MTAIFAALAPVFFLILIGAFMRRMDFPGDGFWQPVDKLIFYVLFPALLVDRIGNADFAALSIGPVAASTIVATLIVAGLLMGLSPVLKVRHDVFSSIFMGSIRFNTFVGIAAAGALYGDAGLTLAAIVIAVQVPLVNFLTVLVLSSVHAQNEGLFRRWFRILRELFKNPLIAACIAGAIINGLNISIPNVFGTVLTALGNASLPLALLACGAGLSFSSFGASRAYLAWSLILKLGGMPICTAATCALFGVDGLTAKVAILFASLPSATSAYIIARQMGGDAPLIATVITVSTILAAITMPLVLLTLT